MTNFEDWWKAFVAEAQRQQCPVASDPESYRDYFEEGLSPCDAVSEEIYAGSA